MKLQSERFGMIELNDEQVIRFPGGVIGFPQEQQFALIPHGSSQAIAWLQSLQNASLAFPVVSAHALMPHYPDVPLDGAANQAGLGQDPEELAVLAVLCAPRGQPATVNLLAPIVVNATTRMAAQLVLDGTRFSTRELFVLPPENTGTPEAAE
jgi:flagellar assembly factor FliW